MSTGNEEVYGKDYDGRDIRCGDVVEEIEAPFTAGSTRWHICVPRWGDKVLELRDVTANNSDMAFGKILNRGPYWRHLDKLDPDTLTSYGANMELSKRILKMEQDSERL